MLDLASRAAEEHLWCEALHVLDVVLDQDPDHGLAADLKARIDAGSRRNGARKSRLSVL